MWCPDRSSRRPVWRSEFRLDCSTLVTHWALGQIDCTLLAEFAGGTLPGSVIGGQLAGRIEAPASRCAVGWFLIDFGTFFTLYQLL